MGMRQRMDVVRRLDEHRTDEVIFLDHTLCVRRPEFFRYDGDCVGRGCRHCSYTGELGLLVGRAEGLPNVAGRSNGVNWSVVLLVLRSTSLATFRVAEASIALGLV